MFKTIVFILFSTAAALIAQVNPHGRQLRFDCSECHTPQSWKVTEAQMKFRHEQTGFELSGRHKAAQCMSCHKNLVFAGTDKDCRSCHIDPHQSTLGQNCQECHNTSAWKVVDINQRHSRYRLALSGVHNIMECRACHYNSDNFIYSGAPVECYSCHKDEYNASINPQHALMNLATDCTKCHTLRSSGWTAENFIHVPLSLKGAHTTLKCSQCHTTKSVTQECFGCHQDDFNRAKEHKSMGYPQNCIQCHNTAKWEGAQFNHSLSQFPLTGAHAGRACAECHKSGYKGTPIVCSACHQDSYNSSVNPDHRAAGISTDCKQCHNTSAWVPSDFKHSSTGFTLTGAHNTLACSDCHKGTMSGLNKECYSCHKDDFTSAANHVSSGYPQTCAQCHSTASWKPANFNHSLTRFTLTGAHINVSCSKCHTSGYTGTSILCYDCHTANYSASVNPGHQKLSLSTICQDCHTTNAGWKPAQFPVHSKYWVIDGAHSAIAGDCVKCHNGNYNNTPVSCFGCHQADFNKTADPPHLTLAFPMECQQCHTKTAWKPASFNHDGQYFPVYSGKHRGTWTKCSDCHTVSTDYKTFSCLNCHEHNKASMDSKHRGKAGYSYVSSECLRCHPRGSSVRGMIQMHEITE